MADKIQKILCGLKEKNELLKEGIKKKVSVTHSAFAALIREFRDISGKAEKIKGEGTDKPADLMEIADLIEKNTDFGDVLLYWLYDCTIPKSGNNILVRFLLGCFYVRLSIL